MELLNEGMCFACGKNNPIGLKLVFEYNDGRYAAHFTPKKEHQGYDNITHGGILSTLLDEAMAKIVYDKELMAVTAELNVRFKKPAKVGDDLIITGRIVSESKKLIDCEAEIRNLKDELIAQALGRFIII